MPGDRPDLDQSWHGAPAVVAYRAGPALFADAAPDRVTDFEDGVDRISVGYRVEIVLAGVQSTFQAAADRAQQLFDANAGDGEVAAIRVGNDTYLFYASNNGAAANCAIQIVNQPFVELTATDFIQA